MNTMTIRKASQDDATALGALHVASWHETYGPQINSVVLI